MSWTIEYSRTARKDAKKLSASGLGQKAQALLKILEVNPFQTPPPYEKLIGDMRGAYSRRINVQHRLVYRVLEDRKLVRILRMWSHYE